MKVMKKFAAFILAAAMLIVMCVPAMAADEKGSITVTPTVAEQTYKVYRLLVLESYDVDEEAYAYKIDSDWTAFFNQGTIKNTYIEIDDQGYVTWKADKKTDEDIAAFAKLAKNYAVDNGITADAEKAADGTTVVFDDLDLGYYLVDSSMGALCSLDTTNPDVTMREKNTEPTVEKKVDRGGGAYGDTNTAKIGDTVSFRTSISGDPGAENYVLHDKMSAGLTFKAVDTGSMYYRHSGTDAVHHAMTVNKDYTVDAAPTDGCSFHVVFTKSFLDSITDKVYINVFYTAELNEDAVVGGTGNPNEAWLKYGDDKSTTVDKTTTYTYKFDLVKTDGSAKILNGATFKLYDSKTGGNEIALVSEGNGVYRVATAAEIAAEGFKAATIEAGTAAIEGLSNGTFYLEEITPPAGFNALSERASVVIADSNNEAELEGNVYKTGGVRIVNQKGSELPSTGGMGTTILYIVGGILVAGAAVLLITRRRMNAD